MTEPADDLERRAAAGDADAQLALGTRLFDARRRDEALAWFKRACETRGPQAMAALGKSLISRPILSVLAGLDWTLAAAQDGDLSAAHLLAILSAQGVALQNWQVALDYIEGAAVAGLALAQAEFAALTGQWLLAERLLKGEPLSGFDWHALRRKVDITQWLQSPRMRPAPLPARIAVVEKFLSHAICDWVIERNRAYLQPAETVDRQTGRGFVDPSRSNSVAYVETWRTDMVLALVRGRIAHATQLSLEGFEDTSILHYAAGQEFTPHCDFLDTSSNAYAKDLAGNGQRVVTFLVYLNDDYEGGETLFPKLNWRFKGRKGDALFFYNVLPDGAVDPSTMHAGSPTTKGEKWLLSQWIRSRPV